MKLNQEENIRVSSIGQSSFLGRSKRNVVFLKVYVGEACCDTSLLSGMLSAVSGSSHKWDTADDCRITPSWSAPCNAGCLAGSFLLYAVFKIYMPPTLLRFHPCTTSCILLPTVTCNTLIMRLRGGDAACEYGLNGGWSWIFLHLKLHEWNKRGCVA